MFEALRFFTGKEFEVTHELNKNKITQFDDHTFCEPIIIQFCNATCVSQPMILPNF